MISSIYPTFIYHIESGKCGKKGKKITKISISREKRAFRLHHKNFS